MKKQAITWMVAFALTGISAGQQSAEEKQFYADYAKSEQRAIAAFPELTNPNAPMTKRLLELEKAWGAAKDPRYNSADKPMLLCAVVAKELGIALPDKAQAPQAVETAVISELVVLGSYPFRGPYKNVTICSIEPDGLRIMHESGAAKIPIEKLSDEQRAKYGLTMKGATQYRSQVVANTEAYYALQQEAARQAQADADVAAEAAAVAVRERQEQIRANPARVAQAPDWTSYVTNSVAREHMDNPKSSVPEDPTPTVIPARETVLEGGKYFRSGDRITINGDLSKGYQIKGDKLYDVSTGTPSHTRSGSMWIPLDSSHSQIHDSEH